MIFLKWYTFILILLSFLMNLFDYGKEESASGFIFTVLASVPMLIYVFLS